MASMINDLVIDVRAISSRSGIVRRDTCRSVTSVGAGLFFFFFHAFFFFSIYSEEFTNMDSFLSFE